MRFNSAEKSKAKQFGGWGSGGVRLNHEGGEGRKESQAPGYEFRNFVSAFEVFIIIFILCTKKLRCRDLK